MPEPKSLSRLTRSLAIGSSVGALALGAGCVPIPVPIPVGTTATADSSATLVVRSDAEGRVCTEAIQQRSAQAVTALMTAYPSSRCIPSVVNAMSASERARIPAEAVAGLPASIRRQLPDGTGGTRRTAQGTPTPDDATARARRILEGGGAGRAESEGRY